jgi:hypothetical protein
VFQFNNEIFAISRTKECSPYYYRISFPVVSFSEISVKLQNSLTMNKVTCHNFFCFGCTAPPPQGARTSPFTSFLDHTQRRTTVGMTPLDVWSARRWDRPVPDNTQLSRQTNTHAPSVSWIHNPSKRVTADLRLRPRSHWDLVSWRLFWLMSYALWHRLYLTGNKMFRGNILPPCSWGEMTRFATLSFKIYVTDFGKYLQLIRWLFIFSNNITV